jgi:hypothetical protein
MYVLAPELHVSNTRTCGDSEAKLKYACVRSQKWQISECFWILVNAKTNSEREHCQCPCGLWLRKPERTRGQKEADIEKLVLLFQSFPILETFGSEDKEEKEERKERYIYIGTQNAGLVCFDLKCACVSQRTCVRIVVVLNICALTRAQKRHHRSWVCILVDADTRGNIFKADSDFECATEKESDRHFSLSGSFLKHALVHGVLFVSLRFPKRAEVMIEEVKWAKGEIFISAKSKHPVPKRDKILTISLRRCTQLRNS